MTEEISLKNKHIVCLGGGIGTSNLLKGLKKYNPHLTVVTSMADDGGSSGRLRKAFGVLPPGDMISCIAALIPDDRQEDAELLKFRFPGNSKTHTTLGGHKFGNIIMLAEMLRTNDVYRALDLVKKLFNVKADILPATDERTHLSATTKDGRRVHTETTLDLALYSEPRGLKRVYIRPKNPKVNPKVIDALMKADLIISGPGDLYTNQLPVLIVPQVKEALLSSSAKKLFIVNIANKPFETKGFSLKHFVEAFKEHLGIFPFDGVIVNNNHEPRIPKKYKYKYIKIDEEFTKGKQHFKLIQRNLVDSDFPLYHNAEKLAKVVAEQV